jgi:hypothetical protein
LSCFGNKSNVNENKEPPLRSKQHHYQQYQQQQQQQLLRQGCRGNECCGIRQTSRHESGTWLECDDEAVRVIPVRELQDKLAPNSRNSATPYLLFYVRSTNATGTTPTTTTTTATATSATTTATVTAATTSTSTTAS